MEGTTSNLFKNKKANIEKFVGYGFLSNGGEYIYRKPILNGDFTVTVNLNADGKISSEVVDAETGEIYTLHLVTGAVGSFVGQIRSEYEEILGDIAKTCFDHDVFKQKQTKELIEHVRNTYGDELEFLWEKFDDNAIWRRKDTKKWYAAILTVQKSKLGVKSDKAAEIIDLRIKPENMQPLIDNKLYFPGWHMNKKSWYTIILDGSVPTEEICRRIDESYILAIK